MDEIGGRMELRSLYYFVRIAELGSITRAAAHLQIAQPALTRHVQRLESELDAALFTRANRGVRLTEAGQKLFDSAQRILRDVERAGDEIRAHKAHPSGKIILGVTPPLCPVVVPELFARMRAQYPLVELKVLHAGTARLEEFIVAGLVDLALMTMISRSRLITLARLAEEEMVLATRPGARPPGPVAVEELNRTPLILGDGMRAALEVLLAGRGVTLRVDTELDDHETIRLMVQQGVGASVLPHSSLYRGRRVPQPRPGGCREPRPLGGARSGSRGGRRGGHRNRGGRQVPHPAADGRAAGPGAAAPAGQGRGLTETGRRKHADRRFADPPLAERAHVAAAPPDPDLQCRRRLKGDGRSRGRRRRAASAQHPGRGGQCPGGGSGQGLSRQILHPRAF